MWRWLLLSWALLLGGIACIAQSERVGAFWQSRDSNYNQNIVSGSGCSQATTVNAALDGSQNTSAVTTLICGLVTDGNYSGVLDTLYVAATNSIGNFEVNWANPGTYNLTSHGTSTFTANKYIVGDGSTGWFDTGYNLGTSGGNLTQNSATFGTCILNNANPGVALGVQDGNTGYFGEVSYGGGDWKYAANQLSENTGNAWTNFGSFIATRTSSALTTFYYNASSAATTTTASASLPSDKVALLAAGTQTAGTVQNWDGDEHPYFFTGAGLTSTQVTNIRNRLETYYVAVGGSGC